MYRATHTQSKRIMSAAKTEASQKRQRSGPLADLLSQGPWKSGMDFSGIHAYPRRSDFLQRGDNDLVLRSCCLPRPLWTTALLFLPKEKLDGLSAQQRYWADCHPLFGREHGCSRKIIPSPQ